MEAMTQKVGIDRWHVRWILRRDMPEVLQIERLSDVLNWSEDVSLYSLRQRNCIGLIAEPKKGGPIPVTGFMIYELRNFSLRILNFAVHPEWRGSNVGEAFIERLKSKLFPHRRTRLVVDVPERLTGFQMFLHKHGFRAVNVNREEETYRMVYHLENSPETTEE